MAALIRDAVDRTAILPNEATIYGVDVEIVLVRADSIDTIMQTHG